MSSSVGTRTSVTNINIQLDEQSREDAILTLLDIADEFDDASRVMLAAESIAIEDMEEHFDQEKDPDGNPWMALTADYEKWKMSVGGIDKILQFRGPLKRAATSPDAWLVTEDALMFNTSVLPEYGTLHQTGFGHESDWHYRERDGTQTQKSLGIGRGNALPSRPFIGLSVRAEERINAVFDVWFEQATSGIYIRESGVAQRRGASGRGNAGSFGPKI